ncbi:MAG: alpha-hydroxy-acid oxidizing enzyme [Candidatus Rokuibacteriota bacterium]|nr:MAG: alpha-hydroxy-acid oxidizing enzyme [Candidatus Rokubacteria bacterium]
MARQRLSRSVWDYISQGAADEITLRRNREAFDALRLRPRVLTDVSKLDTRLELLGQKLDFPILLAPVAAQGRIHSGAEPEAARGASAAGATFIISTFSTTRLEDIARAARGRAWFQLYVNRDRGATRDLVQRAEVAGCTALLITVDTPVNPMRDREKRLGVQRPYTGQSSGGRVSPIYSDALEPTLTWETVAWIRSFAKTPVLLKGILDPDDARRAASEGLAGVVVSNHGGRNLDTTPATIDALPPIIEAAQGRLTILLDGGIRRGTDVVKAIALGAHAVLIGRPYVWGLAVDGAAGVQRVIDILRDELEAAMALCGAPSLDRINRQLVWPER